MKNMILASLIALMAVKASAQIVADTVSVGAGYTNQVWYSLANDEQGTAPKNNWSLAFEASGFGSTVQINSASGVMLWNYPNADTTGWATVDTTGLSGWPARYNSDTSWALGAMGRYANPSNPYDLDWGSYSITTHAVTGDSIYIVKLGDGSYRKLRMLSLIGSSYSFRYANLDGSDVHNVLLPKAGYTGKNFGYYNLQTNAALDREPVSSTWDLVFGQYTTFIPSAYTVTGVLANTGVKVAKCINIGNTTTFTDWASATFNTSINTIGYNWKTFNGTTYDAVDSTVYFVRPANGDIWKLIFTGFGGGANGNCMFTKEKLFTQTGLPGVNGKPVASLAVYPNPAYGQALNIIYSFDNAALPVELVIYDIAGRVVSNVHLAGTAGLGQYALPAGTLATGNYIVTIANGEDRLQQKLVIQM